jgi:hypothetical protein
MFLANELALKEQCVHVPKYSIDASMDYFLGLSNLVVTSSQSINLQNSNYVCLHSSSSLDLLFSTLAHVTPNLPFVSNDDDMWLRDAFKLSMGSLNGVDPCVEPYLPLFESFYIPSIVFGVEDFDVFGHFNPISSKPKEITLLSHFEFVPLLLHF